MYVFIRPWIFECMYKTIWPLFTYVLWEITFKENDLRKLIEVWKENMICEKLGNVIKIMKMTVIWKLNMVVKWCYVLNILILGKEK